MLQYYGSSLARCCRSELPLCLSVKHKSFQSSGLITIFNLHQSVNVPAHLPDGVNVRVVSRQDESLLLSTVVDHTLTSDRNSVTCHLSPEHRQTITHQGLQRSEYSCRPHSDVLSQLCHLSPKHRQTITHQGLQRSEYSCRPHSDV